MEIFWRIKGIFVAAPELAGLASHPRIVLKSFFE
jgi:hypothetical protein